MTPDLNLLKQELSEAFRLEEIPETKREALLTKMGEALLKRIFIETLEKLGEEGRKEYAALLGQDVAAEQIEALLKERIPGYNVFVRGIVAKFKKEMSRDLV